MIPKYESIAADIRRSIEDGALKPGDKLPTVVEFCELYGVSKITVKRAIEQITEEGLFTSRRGSGTYVKDTAGLPGKAFFQGRNDRAQGFTYEHRGEKVASVVYDFSIVNPPAEVASQLGMAEDDFAYHIVRVREVDGLPIVIEYTYMPLELIPGLKKKPSTSELVDWLKLLMADNIGEAVLRERDPTKAIPPLAGALVKNEQDVQLLERLAFMSRRGNR